MAALKENNTFINKVLEDFESQISKQGISRDKASSSSTGAFVIQDNLAKRLVFDERETTAAKEMEGPGRRLSTRLDHPQPCTSTGRKRSWDGDLVSARAQVIKLENTVASLQTEIRRNKLEFDKQLDEMKTKSWREKEAGLEIKLKLQQMLDRDEQRRTELAECRAMLKTKTKESLERIAVLEKEKNDLRDELSKQTTQLDETVFQLKNDLHKEITEKEVLQNELETLEQQLEEFSTKSINVVEQMRIADEATRKTREVEHRIKELELEISKREDDKVLSPILQNELSKLPELQRENIALKEENRVHRMRDENIVRLKEELEVAKAALERSQLLCAELPRCKLEIDDLRQKLAAWEKLSSIVQQAETRSPENVAKAISRLQQQEIILLEKVGTLTADNNALQVAKSAIEVRMHETCDSMQKQYKDVKREADQKRHLQRKLFLVGKERDFYRHLVDNYEKETTVISSSSSIDDDRVTRLESLVDGYKKSLDTVEADLELSHQQLAKFGCNSGVAIEEERARFEREIKELRTEAARTEDRARQLLEEKVALEVQVEYYTLKGEFNPQKTRIVHLASNPVTWERKQLSEELEKFKSENEKLRLRLKLLEEAGGRVEDLTIQVGERLMETTSTKDVEDMKVQLSSAELKNKRLVEAFRKLSADFREVAFTLLGYKLELPCKNQFKLSSAYAESEDHYLLFEKAESGEVSLLETPYSTEISEKIDVYLHTYRSIPAFLSNITLELFNSQTAMQSTSSMEMTSIKMS